MSIEIKHPNRLHAFFGISKKKKIPMKLKEKAANSSDPAVKKMGVFALNASNWNHQR